MIIFGWKKFPDMDFFLENSQDLKYIKIRWILAGEKKITNKLGFEAIAKHL